MTTASDVSDLISAFIELDLPEGAAARIGHTLEANAANPGAWLELAASLRRQQQYKASLLTYQAAERRFPLLPALPNNRGILLREAGLIEEALAAFTAAVALKSDYASALESQGNALELLGRFGEAEEVYDSLLRWEPERATAWNNRGNCLRQLGRATEALRCYEKALELDPRYVFALVNLAGLLDERGERPRAKPFLDRALALDPSDEVGLALLQRFDDRSNAAPMLPPAWSAPSTPGFLAAARALRQHKRDQTDQARVVPELLRRSKQLADRTGFMAWHTDRLQAEPVADPGSHVTRLSPPTGSRPRLFLSYAWAQEDPRQLDGAYENDMIIYAIAGDLFNRGYRIVFDRDPRNIEKDLSEIDVLRRLYDCNYFVPVITDLYLDKVFTEPKGMANAEWNLACQLADAGFLTFSGIWMSGSALPPRLNEANTADAREGGNFAPALRTFFPDAGPDLVGVPRTPAPSRPPEPPDWPKFHGGGDEPT